MGTQEFNRAYRKLLFYVPFELGARRETPDHRDSGGCHKYTVQHEFVFLLAVLVQPMGKHDRKYRSKKRREKQYEPHMEGSHHNSADSEHPMFHSKRRPVDNLEKK